MTYELGKLIMEAISIMVGVILAVYVAPWLKTKAGAENFQLLLEYAELVVRTAKQIYPDHPEYNTNKKKYAMEAVKSKAEELGLIDMTKSEIENIIEGVYNSIKEG